MTALNQLFLPPISECNAKTIYTCVAAIAKLLSLIFIHIIYYMATQFSVPSDNIDRHHRPTIARGITVLQFDHSHDLLASADSDYILRVFSMSQNTYVLRRMFDNPISTIQFKSRDFPGRSSIFIGFDDGSIRLLSFPHSVYDVCINAPSH